MSAWFLQHVLAGALALGTVLALAGLALLYLAWRRSKRHLGLVVLGWMLIVFSYRYWVQAAGFDSGPALGTVVLMLAAIALVLAKGEWRLRAANPNKQRVRIDASALDEDHASNGRTRRVVLRILAAGPLALGTALAIAMLIVAASPWGAADRLVMAACVMLLLWTVGMVWSCAARRLAAPIAAMLTIGGVSLLLLPVLR